MALSFSETTCQEIGEDPIHEGDQVQLWPGWWASTGDWKGIFQLSGDDGTQLD